MVPFASTFVHGPARSVSPLAFAWIEIVDGTVTSLEAYAAPDLAEPIDRASLPRGVGVVVRDDR